MQSPLQSSLAAGRTADRGRGPKPAVFLCAASAQRYEGSFRAQNSPDPSFAQRARKNAARSPRGERAAAVLFAFAMDQKSAFVTSATGVLNRSGGTSPFRAMIAASSAEYPIR
jgi:hypothetical protein